MILYGRRISVMTGAIQLLAKLLTNWAPLENIPELNWKGVMRSLDFQELLGERDELVQRLPRFSCTSCPQFNDHVS